MKTFRITATAKYTRGGRLDTAAARTADVQATTPAVALKRFLDGGHDAHYTYATVSKRFQTTLALGEAINLRIERVK